VDDELYRRSKELFLALCERGEAEREAALLEACGPDTRLLEQVKRLLLADSRSRFPWDGDALLGVAPRALADAMRADPIDREGAAEDAPIPERIGSYVILRRLGEGGMGIVYEAEQSRPRRTVAIKVLRRAILTPGLRRRFEREAEVLGQLRHPGIAGIVEAGTDADGTPFIAMERIEGAPLDEWLDREAPPLAGRIELVARIADAVDHAHRKGIIHRDLKPSNVLVTAAGEPRVLDFGVARLLDAEVEASLRTASGQIVGTLATMSPEQASGGTEAVDARSDVYALGVLLYRALSGRFPHELAGCSLVESLRRIRVEEPPRLGDLDRRLRGDVEVIAAKAIEKDPDRRYASAAELAADLRRTLRDEPIVARPPSAIYQLGKYARRHRVLVGAGLVVATTAIVGGIAVLFALQSAVVARLDEEVQRKEAERRTRIAEEVNAFLHDEMLASANPFDEPDPDLTVAEALDRAGRAIGGRLALEPAIEAEIRLTIANSYIQLGRTDDAEPHFLRAEELFSALDGPDSRGVRSARLGLGKLAYERGDLAAAEEIFASVIAAAEARGEAPSLSARHNLIAVWIRQGRYREAVDAQRSLCDEIRREYGEENARTALADAQLATLLQLEGDLDEAEALFLRAVAAKERLEGEDDLDTWVARSNLGTFYLDTGRLAEAEPLIAGAYAAFRARLGDRHRHTVVAGTNLFSLLGERGDSEAAQELGDEVVARAREAIGSDHPSTATALQTLGGVLRAEDPVAALDLLEEALAIHESRLGRDHQRAIRTLRSIAFLLLESGRRAEAEPRFVDLIGRAHARYGPAALETRRGLRGLATLLEREERWPEAVERRREVLASCEADPTVERSTLRGARHDLARALLASGEPAEARDLLAGVAAERRAEIGPLHKGTRGALLDLARCHRALADPEGELAVRREALPLEREARGAEEKSFWPFLRTLARLELESGDRAAGIALLDEELGLRRRVDGAVADGTLDASADMGTMLARAGLFEEALARVGPALAAAEAAQIEDRVHALRCRNVRARSLRSLGRLDEAHVDAIAMYELSLGAHGPDGSTTRLAARLIASILERRGDEEGATLWRERGAEREEIPAAGE